MKVFIILLLVCMGMDFSPKEEGQLFFSSEEQVKEWNAKEFLLNYYEQTHDQLFDEIDGLSEEQMQYKEAPDIWSVSQNLEHIITTEEALFAMVKERLAQPANPEKKAEVTLTDEELIAQITDRSFKRQASEDQQPEGRYDNPEEAMADFGSQRMEILYYIKSSELDFRDYVTESPFGYVDAYHNFLFLAAHTSRHTLQIEEVKASSGFPE